MRRFHPPQADLFGFHNVARIVLDAGNISLASKASKYHSAVRQNITRLWRISPRLALARSATFPFDFLPQAGYTMDRLIIKESFYG